MPFPTRSGLYFVTLRGDALVSVNDNNPLVRERCIRVNHLNAKLGRARNMRARYRAYCRTFSKARVDFRVLSDHPKAYATEAALLARFTSWRMRGASGRPNEWLEGIAPEDVFQTAWHFCSQRFATGPVAQAQLTHSQAALPDGMPNGPAPCASCAGLSDATCAGAPMPTIPRQAGSGPSWGADPYQPSDMVRLLTTAKDLGLNNQKLRDLHHLRNSAETFDRAIFYFLTKQRITAASNQRYAARLDFVIHERQSGAGVESAIAQALALHPK